MKAPSEGKDSGCGKNDDSVAEIEMMFADFADYYRGGYHNENPPKAKTNGDRDLETQDTKTAWLQLWAGRYSKKGRVR